MFNHTCAPATAHAAIALYSSFIASYQDIANIAAGMSCLPTWYNRMTQQTQLTFIASYQDIANIAAGMSCLPAWYDRMTQQTQH